MDNEVNSQDEFRRKRLVQTGASYSLAASIPLFLNLALTLLVYIVCGPDFGSAGYPDWYIYLLYLMAQIPILITLVIYFRKSGEKVTVVCPHCHIKYFFIAFFLQFGLLFSLSELNDLFIGLLELIGYRSSSMDLPDVTGWKVIPAILVIALVPAVFEETLFRGVLARNMFASNWGLLPTLFVSGAMFSLFHGSPEQTIYQFICGVCFALIAIRSGSILPTMLAHFLNNAIILILASFGYSDMTQWAQGGYIALLAVSAVCLVASLIYLIFLDSSNNRKGKIVEGKIFFSAATIGIAVCAVEWIYVLIAGFLNG